MNPTATYDSLVGAIQRQNWEVATETARMLYNHLVIGGAHPARDRIEYDIPDVYEVPRAAGLKHLVRGINQRIPRE